MQIKNLINNPNVQVVDKKGAITVIEYLKDMSVTPSEAGTAWFCSKMDIRKRQVICNCEISSIVTQAGAMQWMVGNINATTGVKGVGDLAKKMFRGSVTNESAIKPEYVGDGILVLEPTYKHIILEDVGDWGGAMVIDDGLFLACESSIKNKAVMRNHLSSAIAGGYGLFNLGLEGNGIVAMECMCPREELVTVELENEVLKIDGNLALAWSKGLEFTVERAGKTLIGSAASGEGLVNVYRGTGKVLMMPTKASAAAGSVVDEF